MKKRLLLLLPLLLLALNMAGCAYGGYVDRHDYYYYDYYYHPSYYNPCWYVGCTHRYAPCMAMSPQGQCIAW